VRFAHQRLFSSDYVCVMRAQHPLANKRLSLDAFCEAQHALVSFSGRAYGLIDEALASVNRSRRVVLTVNQFFTTGSVVAHSDLLAVMPRHFVQVTGFAPQLAVHELPFEVPPIHVDAIWLGFFGGCVLTAGLRLERLQILSKPLVLGKQRERLLPALARRAGPAAAANASRPLSNLSRTPFTYFSSNNLDACHCSWSI
jgi:hypothetical protein